MFESWMDWYPLITLLVVGIIMAIIIFYPQSYERFPRVLSSFVTIIRTMLDKVKGKVEDDGQRLFKNIEAAGYSYDSKQDMFYSTMDPWQRDMGYCRLYDEAAAPLNLIIDCEPIYFKYAGKRWLIEFWKGQYAMTTGCEIGVYNTNEPDVTIPGVFNGPFFNAASDRELLRMKCSLMKKGNTLFTREDRHWWLTGFKLGEFAEPWELTMDLSITLRDEAMIRAFVTGLKEAGYEDEEITVKGRTVELTFDKARTPQPTTRTPATDWVIQRKNELLCHKYREITDPYDNFPDKVKAVKEKAPEIYRQILNMGKSRALFQKFDIIKKLNR